jgi:hypothetical protein
MQYYYKVVREKNGKLYSPVIDDKDAEVEYKVREWTTAVIPNTKLFIFKELENAEAFCTSSTFCTGMSQFHIYKVEAKGIDYKFLLGTIYMTLTKKQIEDIWNISKENHYDHQIFPWGTRMADTIKLIERI